MVPRVGMRSIATRAALVLAITTTISGCGSGGKPATGLGSDTAANSTPAECARTVLATLTAIARRIYHEGIFSERTIVAERFIAKSRPLREAVESGDPARVRAAAVALVAGGRMTNLLISKEGHVLADVGSPRAFAPLRGTLRNAGGVPIATYVASVWSSEGLLAETDGVAQDMTELRVHGRTVAGSIPLPPGRLPAHGAITLGGVGYQYDSYGATLFPAGAARVYLLRTDGSVAAECGKSEQDTVVNTLHRVANLIYDAEAGMRTQPQVQRVQSDAALLSAVSRREPLATRRAIERLLNQHIVRLRVSAHGSLLADVGGPFVLAPVYAPLRLAGLKIGGFVLSIQDDEGYLRLAHRLAGLDMLMYMDGQLVKNSLGPHPGSVPTTGTYTYRGHTFRVFTFDGKAFPYGPLRIQVLIPIPYS